jgi:radical SAM superfamily enzyme YgiQ (UPF0313 family)
MKIAFIFCSIDDVFKRFPSGAFTLYESNPPIGLGALASIAQEMGHEIKVFDQHVLKYENEELAKAVIAYRPYVIAFSCTSLNLTNTEKCLIHAKSLNETFFSVVGGIHPTLCIEEMHEKGLFDAIVAGEGEEVFSHILKQLVLYGEVGDGEIEGLWLKNRGSQNGVAVLRAIDHPIISRKALEIFRYKNKGALLEETPCYSLFSSRGCPFTCRFCSKPFYHKLYRTRDVACVIEEIQYLIAEFDAKAVSFREDNFTAKLEHVSVFCHRMIEEFNGQFPWECESRASLHRDVLELMYRAGCRGIWSGIETMVPKWQDWIQKGLTEEEVVAFFSDCKEIGIKTGALFMFGFPEQTLQEIEQDIQFALSLPAEFRFFQCLAIFPGSPLLPFYTASRLSVPITPNVQLALIKGKTLEDMLELERYINARVSSPRNDYKG